MFRRSELGLLGLAVLLRCVYFFERGALWGDESALAMNIAPRSFAELGNPYLYTQICPWAYLFFAKLITLVLGDGERALRTFSLLSGLAVPPLVYAAASRVLDRRGANIALALAAIAPFLVYFSAELKPYATDAAVSAAVLAFVAAMLRAPEDRRLQVGLLLFGLFAIWLSLSAIYVLGGASAALAWESRRSWRRLAAIALGSLLWVIAFGLHLGVLLDQSAAASSHGVVSFWTEGFMPFPPQSFADLRWAPAKFFFAFSDPGGFGVRYLAGALFIAGLYAILKKSPSFLIAMIVPLFLLLVASALGRYPVLERLILFTVPIMVLGIAAAASTKLDWIAVALTLVISFGAVKQTVALLEPAEGPDIADFAARMSAEVQPEDGVFIDDAVQWTWLYYGWRHPLRAEKIDTSKIRHDDFFEIGKPQAHLQQLAPLFGKKKVWVVLSDFPKAGRGATFDKYYTHYLESRGGRLLESVRGQGLLLAIYDLSEAHP